MARGNGPYREARARCLGKPLRPASSLGLLTGPCVYDNGWTRARSARYHACAFYSHVGCWHAYTYAMVYPSFCTCKNSTSCLLYTSSCSKVPETGAYPFRRARLGLAVQRVKRYTRAVGCIKGQFVLTPLSACWDGPGTGDLRGYLAHPTCTFIRNCLACVWRYFVLVRMSLLSNAWDGNGQRWGELL